MNRFLAKLLVLGVIGVAFLLAAASAPLGIGLFIIGFVFVAWLDSRIDGWRSTWRGQRVRAIADDLGFEYRHRSPALGARLSAAHFFDFQDPEVTNEIRHAIYGPSVDGETAVFDHGWVRASSGLRLQTVVYVRSSCLLLPRFELIPEPVWTPSGLFFRVLRGVLTLATGRGEEVRLLENPGFTAKYVLTGPDTEAVRCLFDERVQAFLERRRVCVQGYRDQFVFYYPERVASRHKLISLMEEAQQLGELFRAATCSRESAQAETQFASA